MANKLYSLGAVLLVGSIALVVYNNLYGPTPTRRVAFANRLDQVAPEALEMDTEVDFDYKDLQRSIASRPSLWGPLIDPPKAPDPPPNFDQLLRGVTASRNHIGPPDAPKVRITSPSNPGGAWMGAGEMVAGITIKSITSNAVILSITQNGKEYTHALPRGRR